MAGGGRPGTEKAAAGRGQTAIQSTIQSIKEVVGGHSDADIYAALRECNMDPNETTQKLLNQDPFHEVKRKRDKKRESADQKTVADASAQAEHNSQWTKPRTQRVENDQRRAYSHGQASGNTAESHHLYYVAITCAILRKRKCGYGPNCLTWLNVGPNREFRVVRDNRHGVIENRPEPYKGSPNVEVSDRSVPVVQTGRNHPPATTSEGQITQGAKHSYNSDMHQVKRQVQGAAQKYVKPHLKNSHDEQHPPTSDPAHTRPNLKAAEGAVGSVRRHVGVVNVLRQPSARSSSHLHVPSGGSHVNNQRGNFVPGGPSGRHFMSKNMQSVHRTALDSVHRGRSGGRSFVASSSKYQQGPASNQKVTQPAKEWKPKSTKKSSNIDTDNNNGTDVITPSASNTENSNVLDENALCEKTSQACIHEMEHVIIPEHLRVPEYEQTGLSVQEPVQLVVEEDSLHAGHDEVDVEARSSQLNLSTSTAEISLPPSEDSVEMNGDEVENDDGLGLVQSDTPLAPVDGQNMQSASNLTAFSTYGHEDPSMHPSNEAQLYRLVEPNVHPQVMASPSQAISSQIVSSSPVAISQQLQHMSQPQQAAQLYPPVHMQHYPNFMPYRHHIYSPVYVPPMAMPNFPTNMPYPSNGNNYLQMPGGGSHLAAGGMKYGVSQYKPVPAGSPSGYGNYTHPAGFTFSSPGVGVIGGAVGVDDVNRIKYKDNNLYAPSPQVETSDIWIQTPREMPTLQCPPYFNLSGQATSGAFVPNPGNASFNATAQSSHAQFPGLYHPQQPSSIVSPHPMVHQQVPSAIGPNGGVGVATPAPQVGAYQQPQLGHWRPGF
uniref:GBF-interacting protein 1 N-terminal domain-containing protein n=1 Tax=Oryza punctata TaxID=4537 RepID=A0A0E0L939_ORYPU